MRLACATDANAADDAIDDDEPTLALLYSWSRQVGLRVPCTVSYRRTVTVFEDSEVLK